MKKYLLFVFLLAMGLLLATPATQAQNSVTNKPTVKTTAVTATDPFKTKIEADKKSFEDQLKTEMDAFKLEVAKEKTDFKTANADRKNTFWTNAGQVLGQNLGVAITRLGGVQISAGKAIAQLNKDGKNTTDATTYLNLSKQELADAQTKLNALRALYPANGTKVTADIFAQIKLGAREVKNLLKECSNDLMNTAEEIKSLDGETIITQ